MADDLEQPDNGGFWGDQFDRWLSGGILVLVILAGTYAMSPSVADPDLWGHVQFGRDTLSRGVAESTSYSFTADGYRWINHENLSEIVMATITDRFGATGLLWGKFLISLFVMVVIIWFNSRQRVSLIPTCVVALLVAWNLGYHWSFRPQLASYSLFVLLILLFEFCFKDWRCGWAINSRLFSFLRADKNSEIRQSWFQARMLWLVVPIIFLWTNAHGGFVAGVCIAVAYLGLRSIEATSVLGHSGFGYVRRFALIASAIVAVTLINPYSYRLPFWLLQALGNPRPEIVDWSSGQLWSAIGAKYWVLVAIAGFALAGSKERKDLVQCCLLAITLWQSISHFRHVPFFAILCGFWIGPHLQSVLDRFSRQHDAGGFSVTGRFQQAAVYGVVLMMIVVVSWQVSSRLDEIEVDRSVYPVDAIAFIKSNELDGRLVVTYNWAQYAIGALCAEEGEESSAETRTFVAFDGRFRTCYPQEIVDMHFDFLYGKQNVIERYRSPNSPAIEPDRVLDFGNPDLVLNKRFDEATAKHMGENRNWSLLYQDGLAQVWGRKSRFDDPLSKDYFPPNRRSLTDRMPQGIVAWPAIPNRHLANFWPLHVTSNALKFERH